MFYFLASLAIVTRVSIAIPALWSPYYRVMAHPYPPNLPYAIGISVNHDGFQDIQLLTPDYLATLPVPVRRTLVRHYNIPYQLSKRPVESVLILGGGTGNDAAAALRNGAKFVDVVEIDPIIARLGTELHPEKPYQSERVRLFVDDARSFLQKSDRKYDLVIFATLDSHAVFSSLSSIRLDNFVFTTESIKSVLTKLNDSGGIAINFFAIKPWLSQRHLDTLRTATGTNPIAFGSRESQETILLAGSLFDPGRDLGTTDYQPLQTPFTSAQVEPTSDDWPFLFLEKREIPFHYLLPLFIIFLFSLIPFRYCFLKASHINWHLFFMGASFLLIETKSVTTLGLLFGATWMVNSIVIGSILMVILLSNWFTAQGLTGSFVSLYLGLFAALILNFFFPFDALNAFGLGERVLTAGAIITLPLFLAALIFAKAFDRVQSPSAALASNLFGSLVGGLLEYADMWTGLRWLNVIALCLYFISFIFLRRQNTL
jgi:SAM-dependent methyltransferase